MKRLFPLAAVICLFVLWGCPKEQPEEPVLTPIQTSYTIGADGGSLDISFRTNQVCQIKSSAPSWLTVDSPTKAVTTKIFTAKASANSDENPRTANISITAGSLSATITITQDGRPKPPTPPTPEYSDVLENAGTSTYTVPAAGQDITVRVRSNVEYKLECSVDWITSTKADAPHVDDLKFHVAENTGAARSGAISFTYGGNLTFTVTVNQAEFVPAGEDPFMKLSTTVVNPEGNGGVYTISVDANYPYTVDCDTQWIAVEQTGADCVLRIDYNPGEDTRTAQLIFSCEGLVEIVTVSQPGSDATADPFDIGSNLSARGYANCYVVTKAGNFSFDAVVMGNGPAGYIWSEEDAIAQNLWPWEVASVSFTNYGGEKPSRAEILWDDNSTISNVSIDDNLKVSFTATGNKGNAVIAVYNRTNLLWSWHIWCTDSPKRMRHEALDGTPIVLLDRNLGATSCTPEDGAATYGCWYQFGRKDPLKLYHGVAGSMVEGELSVEHSVEHPQSIYRIYGKTTEWFNGSVLTITADLWGNPYALHNGIEHVYPATMDELRKTIYDPCPPGYMVPPEWAWDTFGMDDCTKSEYGLTFSVENGDSFYPFAGFGDSGDMYGGDNGWYGYPGYKPNSDGSKYHHNMRNVVACWSSASAYNFDPNYNSENYHHASMFFYMQNEEASDNKVMVSESSPAFLYPKYAHIRERCCSVRCMRMK